MHLKKIAEAVKGFEGLKRKKGIGGVFCRLLGVSDFGNTLVGLGDDAAVIRDHDSFLLFSADGIWQKLLTLDPYAAGRASVVVNVNDIVATGGKPIAMVNVISHPRNYDLDALLMGMRDACNLYRVPMVGGHYHPDAECPELSVAIIGRATKLLTSHTARAGQDIVVALDLQGARGERFTNSWDATLSRSTEEIWERLGVIIRIAEEELSDTCKDISNPGILGTLAMLLDASHQGAAIFPENIPKPAGLDLTDWLKIYPSYGFILCVDKRHTARCLSLFDNVGVDAAVVGEVQDGTQMTVHGSGREEILFDFSQDRLF
jgi:selenophosphate synthetase-related protein